MLQNVKYVSQNNVRNRLLPLTQSVELGFESEPEMADFNVIKELGKGSFGNVLLVQHKKTNAKYALKVVDKQHVLTEPNKSSFLREVEITYKIHHPNIVKLFGHFEDNECCYLLMEYIDGGDLFSYIPVNGKSKLKPEQTASIIKDVISAVYYIHHMNPPIMHRDIKPENVLITSGLKAKLTDFGLCAYIQPGILRKSTCGSPIYMSPEMIDKTGHNEKIDIWSIGVLFFELLTGDQAWAGENLATIEYNIRNLRISWPEDMNGFPSELIKKILKKNPEERISLTDMLNDPFFTQYFFNPSSCLITPDNKKSKVFLMSKDNPLTWNPINTFEQNIYNNNNETYETYFDVIDGENNQNKEIKMEIPIDDYFNGNIIKEEEMKFKEPNYNINNQFISYDVNYYNIFNEQNYFNNENSKNNNSSNSNNNNKKLANNFESNQSIYTDINNFLEKKDTNKQVQIYDTFINDNNQFDYMTNVENYLY